MTPNESRRYEPDYAESKKWHFEVRTLPFSVGLVNGVNNLESLRVLLLEVVKLFLEQDIFGSDVGEDEGEAGLVGGVLERKVENLIHGGAAEGESAPICALREGQQLLTCRCHPQSSRPRRTG